MRIQKALANAGVASRRKIEQLIADGVIMVNSKLAVIGQQLQPGDKVTVAGKPVHWQTDCAAQLLLYHKPLGEVCTRSDPQARPTVFDSLPPLATGRWISVGRLDINTSGLLLFTNAGELANKLMHPRNEYVREYRVRAYGRVLEATLENLQQGVELEDGWAKFDSIAAEKSLERTANNNWFKVSLHSGRNRLVRRLFASQGLEVNKLQRIRYADYKLPQNLQPGKFVLINF